MRVSRSLSRHTRQETKPGAGFRLHWTHSPSFLCRSEYPLALFSAHALWNLIPSRSRRSFRVTIFPHSSQIIGCRSIHRSLIFPRHTEQQVLPSWAFRLHPTQSPSRLCRSRYRLIRSCCVIPLHSNATGFYLRHRRLLKTDTPTRSSILMSLQPYCVVFPTVPPFKCLFGTTTT